MKKILLTREEFVNIMARMDRVNSVAKKIESLLGESGNDCLHDSKNAADIMLAEQDILIEILERVMEDKYKIIESFVLEQDFGRHEKYNKFIDSNGNEVDVSTAGKIYDYLVEVMD